ncbi:MAG TPA: Gfo/Idh/MocA family oxidoreductase [Sedimentisphaerales bacterium]|nr:Gfo/Idh/MocA family oxidoreductase [Sedimentisphaerales bacterium]HRS11714.1 Gfo/Idh/MocA family oxidoreductase [Sedimentisphaerales bacterium]HRV48377.1 Gfo/Idh/MocA family oxidoreductase [Sedimentisphaerales bacterium]
MNGKRINRRTFLKTTATGALAFPMLVRSSALGKAGTVAPSERVTMGFIGVGGMGTNNMRAFLAQPDVQVLAVCDPVRASDEYGHWYKKGWNGAWFGREPAAKIVEDDYSHKAGSGQYKGCAAYVDFRDLIARDDIDAVCIATPDHWHAICAIQAAAAGKDIYCEKPMTLTIAEGRAVAEAVRQYNVVFQTGTQRRSSQLYRFVCEVVRNGRIGKLQRALVAIGPNNKQAPPSDWQPMPVPEWLDYEMWLGPAPWAPYHKDRCLYTFRFGADYSGGQTTNLGAHGIDIVQWANGTDDTGPVEIEDLGGEFPTDGLFTTATKVHFRARYANGAELVCKTQEDEIYRFEGTEGWIQVPTYSDEITCQPESLKTTVIGPDEIHLYESNDHHRNFVDCIKTRGQTAAPVEVGHRSVTICHLGNIAMQLKSRLHWDPVNERFADSHEANTLLSRAMRSPWHL